MDTNNITSAPQIDGVANLFEAWKHSHTGTKSDFLSFMATPSVERTEFLHQCQSITRISYLGKVTAQTIKA